MTKYYSKTNPGFLTLISSLFVMVMIVISLGFLTFVITTNRNASAAIAAVSARYIAEAGLEKAIWSLNNSPGYSGETGTTFGEGEFDITVQHASPSQKQVVITAYVPSSNSPNPVVRKITSGLSIDTTIVSFNYAVQAGEGGFVLGNNSSIHGNVYSNGRIVGNSSNRNIYGDAFSAESSSSLWGIDNVTIHGNAHARRMRNCTVYGDIYFETRQNCTAGGSVNQINGYIPEPVSFPIGDETINNWKQKAQDGQIINGNLFIGSGSHELGPAKIVGNLTLNTNVSLTITGPIWVTGDILFNNNIEVRLDSSYGDNSEVIIADGNINVNNNVDFYAASDTSKGFILLLSESSTMGSPYAILINNNIGNQGIDDRLVLYARNGEIFLNNNITFKEITAYKITLNNNVHLYYETGLTDVSFSSGPGASWVLSPGTYISE